MAWGSKWAISRRDKNDSALVKEARKLGCVFEKCGPLDYWAHWVGTRHWFPLEIKDPKREGHASEYTANQVRFMQRCRELNLKFETWRTIDDVVKSREGV